MGRVCRVRDCTTGSTQDIRARKSENLKPLNMFAVPKNADQFQKWLEVFPYLKKGNYLCELHFMANDIIRGSGTIKLFDGTVFSHHTNTRLKNGAQPVEKIGDDVNCVSKLCLENDIQVHISAMDVDDISSTFDLDLNSPNDISDVSVSQRRLETGCVFPDVSPVPFNNNILDGSLSGETTIKNTTHQISKLQELLRKESLPEGWSWLHKSGKLYFVQTDKYTILQRLTLSLDDSLIFSIRSYDDHYVCTNVSVTSLDDIKQYLLSFDNFIACSGINQREKRFAGKCYGILTEDDVYLRQISAPRCGHCRKLRQQLQHADFNDKQKCFKVSVRQKKCDLKRRRTKRLEHKREQLETEIAGMKEECANMKKNVLEEAIADLPPEQQEVVKTCFTALRAKSKNGVRYSLDWIYQCLLMRIKNKSLYEDIRTRNILPMPSNETLQKYIQKINSSSFGFQKSIFDCLKEKGSRMEFRNRRGTLLVDEMSLSKGVHFNSRTLKMSGFVDFGHHTPDHLKSTRADHALVFMFQPFAGKWVQVLGSFLSHNQVTGDILQKLIIECIILLDNAGFHVDVVTSDGASWNRKVWTAVGINDKNITCSHPCDSRRELFMVSDFPHLIKTFRNKIMELNEPFWTPVGVVKKKDWETLIAIDKPEMANLSAAFKLTPDHLNPKGYQKMNVPMAFDVRGISREVVRKKSEVLQIDHIQPIYTSST